MRLEDIPIFCISLDSAQDRWSRIEAQAATYGVSIQRWPASTPADLSGNFKASLTPAQKACTCSHVQVWKHVIEKGYPAVLILEDDATFRHDWKEVLGEKLAVIDKEDNKWEGIFLNCSESISPKQTWSMILRQALSAGYLLHRRGIDFLFSRYGGEWYCIDWMTQVLQERKHCYSIFPWLVIQDGSASFIQKNNSPDYQKVLRLLSEVNYPIENYRPQGAPTATSRISWTEYFSALSQLASQRSPCHRLRVGCVLVRENHIISTGYNGFLPGGQHRSLMLHGHEQATVHAEMNCIADCARRGVSTESAEAYITHYPCPSCFKGLVAAGVRTIYYLEDYNNSPVVAELMKDLRVKVVQLPLSASVSVVGA